MLLTVVRTSPGRMTDMYVLRFPKYAERFVSFTVADWKKFCPDISLEPGASVTCDFLLSLSESRDTVPEVVSV